MGSVVNLLVLCCSYFTDNEAEISFSKIAEQLSLWYNKKDYVDYLEEVTHENF